MAKQSSRNNDFLFSCKNTIASPKLYDYIVDLVNEGKEEDAKKVAKIDYFLDYLVAAIKARDKYSIIEMSDRIKIRFKELEEVGIKAPMLKESFDKVMKTNKVKL